MSLNPIEKAQGLRVRSTQDLAAGIFMIVVAAIAIVLSRDLSTGTLRQIGPGMLPISFAVICGGLGVLQIIGSLRYNGEKFEGWSWRGIFFVLGGACVFALAIRGFDIGPISVPALGLLVAGPLVMLIAGVAAGDVKPVELVLFTIGMCTACILLFKYALNLPIPMAPWLIGI